MPQYYDDNFGQYNLDEDPEDVREFYRRNRRLSVSKKCRCCSRTVKLLPQYDLCNSCAEDQEQGWAQ